MTFLEDWKDLWRVRTIEARSPGFNEPRNANSFGLASSLVALQGPGRLYGFAVSSTRASGQFIQVFDAVTVPADTAVPLLSIDIATVVAKGYYLGSVGRWFNNGVVICNSTTQATKTIGAADCIFDVQVM